MAIASLLNYSNNHFDISEIILAFAHQMHLERSFWGTGAAGFG